MPKFRPTRKAIPGQGNRGLFKYEGLKEVYYFCRLEAKGRKPLSQKLDARTLNEARAEFKLIQSRWLGKEVLETGVSKLVEEHWPDWFGTKSDKRIATRESIANSSKHLLPFFGPLLPSEVTPKLWEDYLSYKRSEHLIKLFFKEAGKIPPKTIKEFKVLVETDESIKKYLAKNTSKRKFYNDWKWFNMFLIYLHSNGHIKIRPTLRNPDIKSDIGRVLSEEEVSSLLVHAHDDLQIQIIMAVTQGMRIGEIMSLAWGEVVNFDSENFSWVDLEKRIIFLRAADTKIKKKRTFGLSGEAESELRHLKSKAKGTFLFPAQADPNKRATRNRNRSAWRTARIKANVKCRFHDLRHTFLTWAFKGSKGKIDSIFICDYAGLSIEEAQKTYLHFDHEDTRIVSQLVSVGFKANQSKPELSAVLQPCVDTIGDNNV